MRLFLCLPCPAALVPVLQRCREEASGVRTEPPDRWHVTLRFLGEVPAPLVPEVIAGAREAARSTPRVELARPRLEVRSGARPLAWIRFDDLGGFATLVRAIRERLDARSALAGVLAVDDRPPLAHLTIARDAGLGAGGSPARDRLADAWRSAFVRANPEAIEPFAFEVMELWRSDLHAAHARYACAERFALGV